MTKNTGGPAFPVIESERCESVCEGMTIRDHFAELAMQGRLASFGDHIEIDDISLVQFAYRVADAMLAEREKGND